jgi:4-amino-4-deoxy-L-arabinose transferase-like glycosyltransferase
MRIADNNTQLADLDRSGQSKLSLPILLALHALVWTLSAWISTNNLDMNGDMVENYVWGIEWQGGYTKHPPLFAWVTAAWFSVFPHQDWIYYALSAINAAVGLLGVAAFSRRFISTEAATMATIALAISPFYTSLAMKFNANAILLSTWPWAAYFFVVFMQSGALRHALFFGILIGLAALGKYFSAVLILALLITAITRPDWRKRLLSSGTIVALLAALIVLAPHIIWMADHQFSTLSYASQRSAGTLTDAVLRYARFSIAQLFYLLPSFGLLLLLVRKGERKQAATYMFGAIVRPAMQGDLWWLSFASLFVVGLIAVLASVPMASGWGMSQWFALGALWLAVLKQKNIRLDADRLPRIMGIYWLLVLMVSILMAWNGARKHSDASVAPHAELAQAAEALWHKRMGKPLAFVGGSGLEASSVAFYSHDPTHLWMVGEGLEKIHSKGVLFICAEQDGVCADQARSITHKPAELMTVNKQAWGQSLPSRNYYLFLIEPR